jgi:hypothetical protein
MENFDIVRILGIGLSGFGFLLMYLAYRLINRLVGIDSPNTLIVSTINRYMMICFIMTVTVGLFTFLTNTYKKEILLSNKMAVEENSNTVKILLASQNNNQIANRITTIASNEKESSLKREKILEEQEKQQKELEAISAYVAKGDKHDYARKINSLTRSIKSISDSLAMSLDSRQINVLKSNYAKLNDSISALVVKIANEPVGVKKSN